MADRKISQLPSATTPLAGTEELAVVQSGDTKKVTVGEFQPYDADTAKLDVAQTWTADQKFEGISTNLGANTPYSDAHLYLGTGGDPSGTSADSTGVSGLILSQAGWKEHMAMLRAADAGTAFPAESQAQMFVKYRNIGAGQYQWRKSMAWHYNGNAEVVDGNLVIGTSGKGIDFSADGSAAGMTSELLDDYEEGTFTPVIADAVVGGNVGTAAQSYGYYTKVGRNVTIHLNMTNIDTTGLTSGNDVYIQGLPFTSLSVTGTITYNGTLWGALIDLSTVAPYIVPVIGDGQSAIFFKEWGDNTGTDSLVVSQLTTGSDSSDLNISLSYFAA